MLTDGIQLIQGSYITNLVVAFGASFPSSPDVGELFYKTSATEGLYVYDGSTWNVSGGGGGGAITLTGDVTGSGTGSFAATLASVGTAGTYKSVTTDAKGRVTAGTNPTTLSGYGISDAVNTSQLGVNSGVATLDSGGKLAVAQIPAIAITDTFVVASQAAQEALTAEVGDVAVRTDENKSYILRVTPASTFANWQELLTPTTAVTSVNGQTGATTVGTVTSASVVTANGISGTVATATTTPAFTLTLGAITPSSVAASGTVTGSNLSGTNTGNQTITLTGDVTGSGTGSFAATLASVGTAGTYKSVTTDAKGRVTAGTNPTTLAGYGITDGAALDTANSWTATQTFSGSTNNPAVSFGRAYTETQVTATVAATTNLDLSLGNNFTLVLGANITSLTFSNVPASGRNYSATLFITQGAGPYTISWPSSVKWPGGTAPTLTATNGKVDIITLVTHDGGTNWRGFVGGQNY